MYGNYDWDDARMMADLDARDRALQAQDRRDRTEGHSNPYALGANDSIGQCHQCKWPGIITKGLCPRCSGLIGSGQWSRWPRITDETAGPVIEPFDFSPVQVPERNDRFREDVDDFRRAVRDYAISKGRL
jgi:hypothetical protein